ncbi:hypothetical protein [Neptuniibacter sp. QD37_11]|uniref:hypothetical protein n=1 Tax=Neptuniibacter sp. QD37_11 TaxID=3398209 RepID=UPI0039F64877
MKKILMALFLGAFMSSAVSAASNHRDFTSEYLNNFGARDFQALIQMFDFDYVGKQDQQGIKDYVRKSFAGKQIRRIYVDEITRSYQPSIFNGTTAENFNVRPTGILNIHYVHNDGRKSHDQYIVGRKGGQIMIGQYFR